MSGIPLGSVDTKVSKIEAPTPSSHCSKGKETFTTHRWRGVLGTLWLEVCRVPWKSKWGSDQLYLCEMFGWERIDWIEHLNCVLKGTVGLDKYQRKLLQSKQRTLEGKSHLKVWVQVQQGWEVSKRTFCNDENGLYLPVQYSSH